MLDFQCVIKSFSVRFACAIQTNNKVAKFYGLQSELIMLSILCLDAWRFSVYYVKLWLRVFVVD